jgi:enamine deaminase RidA (YjgF/YER057c/UK114 family)
MPRQDEKLTELHTSLLRCAYLPAEYYRQIASDQPGRLLGAVCFADGAHARNADDAKLPLAHVAMAPLCGPAAACEVWSADGELMHGAQGALRYSHNGQLLFGAIQLDEADFHGTDEKTPLRQAAEAAYRAIFQLTDSLAYPAILRFWNYIGDINGESHGMERYRQFNMGRQDGFLSRGRQVAGAVPAASAVGAEAGPLTVAFLAGRGMAPLPIENPRQISAYAYPADYGPRSPTFSRASVCRIGDDDVLFLSGTASIVGHRTVHPGDVVAQTRETVRNIEAMIAEANRVAPQAGFTLGNLCYKVYVRHPADVGAIREALQRSLGASARLIFLRADICRQDLLVEIEATAGHPLALLLDA